MKQLNAIFILILVYNCTCAQVAYTNVNPVRVINGTPSPNMLDSVKMHPAHPLSTTIGKDSALHIWHFDATAPGSNDVGVDCRGNDIELLKLGGSPVPSQFAAIDSGVMIDAAAGTWVRPNYARIALEGAADNWDSQTDKYLGVRFKRNSQWYYGWVKMSIDALPTKAELKGYAYEKTAGKGIVAGNKGSASSVAQYAAIKQVQVSAYNGTVVFYGIRQPYSVSIADVNGRVVHTAGVDQHNTTINLQHMAHGMYMVKLQSGQDVVVRKFQL